MTSVNKGKKSTLSEGLVNHTSLPSNEDLLKHIELLRTELMIARRHIKVIEKSIYQECEDMVEEAEPELECIEDDDDDGSPPRR